MPTSEIDFQDLLEALDNITALLTRFTPKDTGQLASLRVRVMRSLTIFLKLQDERCSQLLLSSSTENKATARQIKKEVSDLRALISAHVARMWRAGRLTPSRLIQSAIRRHQITSNAISETSCDTLQLKSRTHCCGRLAMIRPWRWTSKEQCGALERI